MDKMTHYERMKNTLERKPVDLIPVAISPWPETKDRWINEGHIKKDEDIVTHFDLSFRVGGWLNCIADQSFETTTIEETDETILQLNGNGATLRRHKLHSGAPEHVDFQVKDQTGWRELIRPHLIEVDRRRISFENYREQKSLAQKEQRFFFWQGIAPFEQMHPVVGHENMLIGMALDPDWIKDMVNVYSDMTINHLETLFAEEGKPDGLFFCEDMGFKNKPFISPKMYEELIMPGHKKLFDFAHSIGCKVVVHSCGFVEPLIPGLIKAGMDCLQALEVKAGMDMPHLFDLYGDSIAFFGNIDARILCSNNRQEIDKELQKKIIPILSQGGSYILHSDHSEPPQVNYDTIWYFLERGQEIAKSTIFQKT